MSLQVRMLVLGSVVLLLTLLVVVVAWRREGTLRASATTAPTTVPGENPASSPGRAARYVGAYTVPLTADGDASGNGAGRLSEVMASSSSSAAKAQALIKLFPQLSAPAQATAAQHIVNLLPDQMYETFATHLTNTTTSAEVRAIAYADLLHRPNAIKLPWLLSIARSSGLRQANEAAALLQATLRTDPGADWNAWSEQIHAWLQAHPEASQANGSNY